MSLCYKGRIRFGKGIKGNKDFVCSRFDSVYYMIYDWEKGNEMIDVLMFAMSSCLNGMV